jgi:hypothetical protein
VDEGAGAVARSTGIVVVIAKFVIVIAISIVIC